MTEKPFEKANVGGDAEAQARQVLLAGQKQRVQTAQREAEAIYAKHRVSLDVYMIVRPAGTIVQARFVPQEGWAGDPGTVSPREAVTMHNF